MLSLFGSRVGLLRMDVGQSSNLSERKGIRTIRLYFSSTYTSKPTACPRFCPPYKSLRFEICILGSIGIFRSS